MGEQKFYTPEQMAELASVSVESLAKMRQRRQGPPYVTFGRLIRYPSEALTAWALSEARRLARRPGEVTAIRKDEGHGAA